MYVSAHAIARITDRLTGPQAESIIRRLEAMPGALGDVAIEVYRQISVKRMTDTLPDMSNGDQIIVIARDGSIETVMLRRSWNQPFTASALGVDRVERMPV